MWMSYVWDWFESLATATLKRTIFWDEELLAACFLMVSCFVYSLTLKNRWNSKGPHSGTFQTTVPFKFCLHLVAVSLYHYQSRKIDPQKLTVAQLVKKFLASPFMTLWTFLSLSSSQLPYLYPDRFISVHAPTTYIFQFYAKSIPPPFLHLRQWFLNGLFLSHFKFNFPLRLPPPCVPLIHSSFSWSPY
jgi:hypothetical protein